MDRHVTGSPGGAVSHSTASRRAAVLATLVYIALTNVCDEDGSTRYTCCANTRCRLYRACRGITRARDNGCKEPCMAVTEQGLDLCRMRIF